MKVQHFVLIFLIFFLATVLKTDVAIGQLKTVENEKKELTESLDSATSDAVNYLAKTGEYGTDAINKDKIIEKFFTSFYTSMGILSDQNAKAEMEMYIPVIVLCDTDGYYVYYYNQYTAPDDLTYAKRQWSEKMPYYYKDNCFLYRFTLTDQVSLYDVNHYLPADEEVIQTDYHELQTEDIYKDFRKQHSDCILLNNDNFKLVKKGAIINQLEKVLAYYTSRHNEIAQRNGITYNFSFPAGRQSEWAHYMDDVNLVIVFQGYPYGIGRDYTINKIACAGANVIKKPLYYVEKKGWYYLAHRAGCPKLAASTTVLEETFSTLEECAKYGAYCDDCIEDGARVPEVR